MSAIETDREDQKQHREGGGSHVSGDFTYRLYEAMENLLAARGIPDVSVDGFEQQTRDIGYCHTCAELVTKVTIRYLTDDDQRGEYTYIGDMGELIRELTDQGHVEE